METGNFLMPLLAFFVFERHAKCIATDGSYIYLRRSLPCTDRLTATGALFLPTHVITMVSLVLYESGTNALKYGAWSAPKGVVSIGWLASEGTVTAEWKEHDGPPIKTPHTLGAGAKLIRTAIPDAVVDYRLEQDGARCKIELPLGERYMIVRSRNLR
jgi:two-component sensor histidine kinase